MEKLNKTCCVDGVKYSYCNNCSDDANKPRWMISFCSENCKNIYEAVAGYGAGKYTKEEAKELLDKCDLSKEHDFTNATKRLLKEIYQVELSLNKQTPIINGKKNKRNK